MKNTTNTPLMTAPHGDVFGFCGTIKIAENLTEAETQAAWECAMTAVTVVAGGSGILARNFLRSRYGRHFADAATSFYHGSLASRIQQASGDEDSAVPFIRRLRSLGHAPPSSKMIPPPKSPPTICDSRCFSRKVPHAWASGRDRRPPRHSPYVPPPR
jgi:hypothetical protein